MLEAYSLEFIVIGVLFDLRINVYLFLFINNGEGFLFNFYFTGIINSSVIIWFKFRYFPNWNDTVTRRAALTGNKLF